MFEVKITASSIEELADKAFRMGRLLMGVETGPTTAAVEDKPTPAKSKAKPAADKPKAEEPKAQEPDTSDGGEEPVYTDFDRDVAPAFRDAVNRAGRDAVVGVLDEFGVSKAAQVEEHLWPDLVAKLNDLA